MTRPSPMGTEVVDSWRRKSFAGAGCGTVMKGPFLAGGRRGADRRVKPGGARAGDCGARMWSSGRVIHYLPTYSISHSARDWQGKMLCSSTRCGPNQRPPMLVGRPIELEVEVAA